MLVEKIIDLLYPRRCPVCFNVVAQKEGLIHGKCRPLLKCVHEPACLKCGKPIENATKEYCVDCGSHKYTFKYGKALWVYNEASSQSVLAYKYKGKKEYAGFYSRELLKAHGSWICSLSPDAIIPVPLNRKKQRMRGFNQAELIARNLSLTLKIPMDSNLLLRNRLTAPQKELNPKERLRNLKKAFSINPKHQKMYRRVLLIDDIYTTGSTIEACAKVLTENGTKEVYFLCLCIGHGY
jgi:ComF family protein